jgi:hypothetical protein
MQVHDKELCNIYCKYNIYSIVKNSIILIARMIPIAVIVVYIVFKMTLIRLQLVS